MNVLPLSKRFMHSACVRFCSFAATAVLFAPLLNGELAAGKSVDLDFNQLAAKLPPEKAQALLGRFGEALAPGLVLEESRKRFMKGALKAGDRETIDEALKELAGIPSTNRSQREKAQLSEAWKEAAFLTRRLDGPTDESNGYLEIAYSLNPSDEALAKEVKFQRDRKAILAGRLAEAARIREAKENGEDPYIGLPSIGEGSADLEGNR